MSRLGIIHSTGDVVFVVDPSGRVIESNAAFASIFDSPNDRRSILDIWPEISEFWQPVFAASESGKQLRVDIPATDREGRSLVFDVRLFVADQPDSMAGLVVGIARDVTTERNRAKDLEIRATTDSLTGAYNRNQLEVLLTQAIRSARRRKQSGCFLFLDMVDFKQVNDTYGHDEGDRVLQTIVAVLRSTCATPTLSPASAVTSSGLC